MKTLEGLSMKKSKGSKRFVIGVSLAAVALIGSLYYFSESQDLKVVKPLAEDTNSKTDKLYPEYEDIKSEKVEGFELDRQPFIGDEKAPITLIEFGDYKCPPCAEWANIVYPDLYKNYISTGKAKLYFINFQFLAPDSRLAGIAGEAIYKQNKEAFWDYNKAMYANQPDKSETWATHNYLVNLVKENVKGIDYELFEKDLKEFNYFDEVKMDYEIAATQKVTGTPTVFVNGVKSDDPTFDSIKRLIDKEIVENK